MKLNSLINLLRTLGTEPRHRPLLKGNGHKVMVTLDPGSLLILKGHGVDAFPVARWENGRRFFVILTD